MNRKNSLLSAVLLGIISLSILSFSACKDDSTAVNTPEQNEEKKDTIAWTKEQVFLASDSLEVRADLYMAHDRNAPFIVLFHQAGWSRGEYLEIAPKLNAMGFNCMAVDQRSGRAINGLTNITNQNATAAGKPTTYVDAIPDMLAAIEYAKENFSDGEFIIWGSSYSSALVLKLFGDDQDLADKSLSFAPGEYFTQFGKPADWVTSSAKNIQKPVFITSAKNEKNSWWNIYQEIPAPNKAHFLPTTEGNHGSRALWDQFSDSKDYWAAVEAFLK